jgi:hypothetical protein
MTVSRYSRSFILLQAFFSMWPNSSSIFSLIQLTLYFKKGVSVYTKALIYST